MDQYLTIAGPQSSPRIELSPERHDLLLQSKDALLALINFEEEWDCVVQNFIELETDIIGSALQTMLARTWANGNFSEMRLTYARRLSNLLSSCRSYLDHAPHHLGRKSGPNVADQFKKLTSEAYDRTFAYRFMEALRNYAQHRGLPLHGARLQGAWVEDGNERMGKLRHTAGANIVVEKLRSDGKFKSAILAEIPSETKTIDVVKEARNYLEELGEIHVEIRKSVASLVTLWSSELRSAIAEFSEANDGDVLGLAVYSKDDEGNLVRTDIFEGFIERLDELQQRNGGLVNLSRRYVSSEVTLRST